MSLPFDRRIFYLDNLIHNAANHTGEENVNGIHVKKAEAMKVAPRRTKLITSRGQNFASFMAALTISTTIPARMPSNA